jgi:cell wall-associated NlpC family hydrolase
MTNIRAAALPFSTAHLRTRVRRIMVVTLIAVGLVVAPVPTALSVPAAPSVPSVPLPATLQVQPVSAVPINERAATWIAATAREVALELRAVGDLPERETAAVAGRQINELAALVAHLLDADVDELRSAWTATSLQRKIVLFSALSQIGVPYRLNADAPFIALDCSSLTKFAWIQGGIEIDRGSAQQYARAKRIDRDEVQAGDLIWYPGHIMMSLGVPDLIVHARSGERAVEIHRIDSTRLKWMRFVSPLG